MVLISQIFITVRFTCWDLFITAQIVAFYCWDWHTEIPTTIIIAPHWNMRIFRMLRYRGSIITFAYRETLLLSCVPWKHESLRRVYVEEKFGSCGCWGKYGPEVLSSGSNVSWAWCPLLGVECELGVRPEALSPRSWMCANLVSRVRCPLEILLMRQDTCRDLGSGQVLTSTRSKSLNENVTNWKGFLKSIKIFLRKTLWIEISNEQAQEIRNLSFLFVGGRRFKGD